MKFGDKDTRDRHGSVQANAPLIEEHFERIRDLARHDGVARLEVFGSVCTPGFDPEHSDIDFLVEYPPNYDYGPWLARIQDLETDLRALVGRDVHLVMTAALRNERFRKEAAKTRTVIYDASEVVSVG